MFFYEERLKRIISEIQGYIYRDRRKVTKVKIKPAPYSARNIIFDDSEGWTGFGPEDRWGSRDQAYLFDVTVEIPKEYEGETVKFEVETGREGQWDALNPQFMVFFNNKLLQGLDANHRGLILVEKAVAGEVYPLLLHAYSGMNEGKFEFHAYISILEKETENLYYNLKVPYDVALMLNRDDKRRIDIIEYLNNAINMLDLRKPYSPEFYESVKEANNYLEREFYGKYCGHDEVVASCVGHTHIDVAWLWPLEQTREKAARSFSTMLALMERYPEYIFMSSQPQLYKFIKQNYPELYEKIRKKIKEGKWEPEGAMWLEADCNISSGESLVRQILFGTRFFREEFGIESKVLWLPDVFGYSAALPQIMKKSGIEFFMTTKISWNEYNKVPYDTFVWRGLDESEVLTHFITTSDRNPKKGPHATTYNGILAPPHIIGAWERYQQKDLNNDVLVAFGYGDGGGGPTDEMLENARRMAKGIPGCPRVKMSKVLDYFKRLKEKCTEKGSRESGGKYIDDRKLPRWVGELYLEYHRGTYTSIARNKKFNRKCEFLYQDAEMLSVMGRYAAEGYDYPQDKLNEGWELILLNQFHDILPGSSIKEVYEHSRQQYLKIHEEGQKIVNGAIKSITEKIKLKEKSIIVLNQLGFERSDIVEIEIPEAWFGIEIEITDSQGKIFPVQRKDGNSLLFFAEKVPPKGYKTFTVREKSGGMLNGHDSAVNLSISNSSSAWYEPEPVYFLSNEFFDISFDENYNIKSIYDKKNCREVIREGERANVLLAFEDKPHNYDAWNINIYYREKMWEIKNVESAGLIERGPVRTGLKITRKFLDSIIEQIIYIYNHIPRIDFATRIDWKERQILLKAAFPVDVHSEKATFDIQYGNVERPTHWNTSWDYARFESVAHKWVDISEDGYGVSLLNDCKYGHDVKDGVIRITLLKSAVSPNTDADREVHEFTYSLYPHGGGWREGNTVQMAYALNCPMYSLIGEPHEGSLPPEFSLLKTDKDNVIPEVIKKAEDSDDIVIRVYECYNRRTNVSLTFFRDLTEVWECDLMENNIGKVDFAGNKFEFTIRPYEIKTFKIK